MTSLLSGIRASSQSPGIAGVYRSLNDPRLFEPTPLRDALDEALTTYVSLDSRPRREAPTLSDFTRRVHGYEILNQYVVGGQWRALALASESSIIETFADDRRTLLKYWVYRILALTQMGASDVADRELGRLEQVSELKKWPFELRVLRAQVPGLAYGAWIKSVDRLSALLRGCRRMAEQSQGQRVFRLSLILLRCVVEMQDSSLATQILDQLAVADDPLVLSAAARMYLQLGGIPAAERLFVRVEGLVPKDDKLTLMNRALYAVAAGKWETAREMFAQVQAAHPEHLAAGNNLALCDLYLGQPQAMLNGLQALMGEAPAAAGTSEELVFNYCTGLDLHYDGARLRDAKAKKLAEVATWAGDGFDTTSFKLM
ncbi:hypothetical protein GGH94_002325 [Coemansia aciculifera]|uniref:Tetratricopeptide repeat protein n=1 Tax=Coemansia aciculifera TaxID=417176 RepID=A0A9W8M5L9_9FUNG|nr:hypothetical protein GGH94_002325 [Coemansia aciculifera]KAJ2873756.1 hypothetical protein GGH93_002972 [Coemansia aciculifera]KAJ2873776.1 hypothetical protein GGH93_002955 [Coemansia aciculifera]